MSSPSWRLSNIKVNLLIDHLCASVHDVHKYNYRNKDNNIQKGKVTLEYLIWCTYILRLAYTDTLQKVHYTANSRKSVKFVLFGFFSLFNKHSFYGGFHSCLKIEIFLFLQWKKCVIMTNLRILHLQFSFSQRQSFIMVEEYRHNPRWVTKVYCIHFIWGLFFIIVIRWLDRYLWDMNVTNKLCPIFNVILIWLDAILSIIFAYVFLPVAIVVLIPNIHPHNLFSAKIHQLNFCWLSKCYLPGPKDVRKLGI